MKRRSFVITIILGLLGIAAFPFISLIRNNDKNKVFTHPKILSLLCDRSTIEMLGCTYLKLKPAERNDTVLKQLLLGTSLGGQDMPTIESHIEKRIKNDFDADNIVVVEGWVLSITEARQCAFYSIINT